VKERGKERAIGGRCGGKKINPLQGKKEGKSGGKKKTEWKN